MKKGFTIIEVLASAALTSVVMTILISMFLTYNSSFCKESQDHRNYFYSMEALMYIQHQVETANSLKVNNNTLELEFSDDIVKHIYLNNKENLIIVHNENGKRKTPNEILGNVKEFNTYRKNDTIYVSLMLKNGENYEICIGKDT